MEVCACATKLKPHWTKCPVCYREIIRPRSSSSPSPVVRTCPKNSSTWILKLIPPLVAQPSYSPPQTYSPPIQPHSHQPPPSRFVQSSSPQTPPSSPQTNTTHSSVDSERKVKDLQADVEKLRRELVHKEASWDEERKGLLTTIEKLSDLLEKFRHEDDEKTKRLILLQNLLASSD